MIILDAKLSGVIPVNILYNLDHRGLELFNIYERSSKNNITNLETNFHLLATIGGAGKKMFTPLPDELKRWRPILNYNFTRHKLKGNGNISRPQCHIAS